MCLLPRARWACLTLAIAFSGTLIAGAAPAAAAPCDAPIANEIACENTKPGNPASEWDVSGAGTASIQGYATSIGVDQGQTVSFKVDTPASDYRIDIYRMGYYGGQGARKVATVQPSASLPQNQPDCQDTASTGLVDCANWGVSASWAVPADAVSGIYLAKLVREDGTTGSSHMVFVVRDDDGRSDLLFQTSDTTWQAYNQYGGNSLYTGSPAGRAYKVSYNRPFTTRGYAPEDWVFNAEYPMVRWLERNGYDMSYTTGVDADRLPAELLEHKTFLSVGHDEYWSGQQRANVEAARAAGVNLAFFSGNEVFWKTRWENGYRTLVTYKETHANGKIDPELLTWTGTWRDPRFSPPGDGGRPENALTGQLFQVNAGATTAIRVPAADGKMRFWRNTTIATQAAGATATLPNGTLGYEWDEDIDNGFRPAGSFRLSATTVANAPALTDYGSNFAQPHRRAQHDALPHAERRARVRRRHRAVGMGAGRQPRSRQRGRRRAHAAGDPEPDGGHGRAARHDPVGPRRGHRVERRGGADVDDHAPAAGATVAPSTPITISGTATDAGGGQVGGVEVSTNGGETWRRANGRGAWTFSWTPGASSSYTIRSRAADDSGNLENPGPGVTVTTGSGNQSCPCSIWGPTATPATPAETSDSVPDRGRRALPRHLRGPDHRRALLQGRDEHRHPRRPPLEPHGHAARDGDVHERDGVRLAGGPLQLARGRDGEHDVHRLLSRAARQLREQRRLLRHRRRRQRPAAGAERRRGRRQRRLRVRRERQLPDRHLALGELLGGRRLRDGRRRSRHDAADGDAASRPGAARPTSPSA